MEPEFDILPYLRALIKRWHWVALAGVSIAIGALAVSFLLPPKFTATISVVLRTDRNKLTLDERFITEQAIDAAGRRKTLLALATSPSVATHIPTDTLKLLFPDNASAGSLAGRISAKNEGDLMLISASAPSAEEARKYADTWARAYVAYVNQLYTPVASLVTDNPQVREATERYTAAQEAYEEALGSSRYDQLQDRISAITNVISGTLEADTERYAGYLSRIQSYELMVRDAEALRAQLDGNRPIGLGESLGVLLLRARAVGGGQLPIELQLDQGAANGQDGAATLADLDALITSLKQQIDEARKAADTLSNAIVTAARAPESSHGDQHLGAYSAELARLRSQQEVEKGKLRRLEQERELAFDALKVVRSKLVEQQVVASQSDAEVRLAGNALLPTVPSGPNRLLFMLGGGVLGLLLATVMVLLIDFAGRRLPLLLPRRRRKQASHSPSSG